MLSVSVVVPIYNEVDSVPRLYEALDAALPTLGRDYEVIFIDDGSLDGSRRALREIAARDRRVKVIEFRGNFGQTAAMSAGLDAASNDVIVTLDGDLQNDPADIPRLLDKIDEGYDLVHGWRRIRRDPFLHRRLPSMVANWIISKATGFPVHDLGCTLKAMRREIAQELELYGEMHRFIPILASRRGARCAEIETRHHPRRFGTSKYGLSRSIRVVLDLMTVKYLVQHLVSPMKLFGGMGLVCGLIGAAAGAATIGMKLLRGIDMTGNPLLLLTVFSVMLGAQFLALGMLGELGTRIYFLVREQPAYAVRDTVNFDAEAKSDPPRLALHRAA